MLRARHAAPALAAVVALVTGCGTEPVAQPTATAASDATRPASPAPTDTASPKLTATPNSVPTLGRPAVPNPTGRSRETPPDGAILLEAAANQPRTAPQALAPRKQRRMLGADVSWPQCPPGMGIPERKTLGAPMPTAEARFVVIGLTNGPSFSPNPCLADQVAWSRERGLAVAAYSVVSYPTTRQLARHGSAGPFNGTTRLGALRNVGNAAAFYNLATMGAAGLQSPVVWIDVEPVSVFEWSGNVRANAAVVQGMVHGYRSAGLAIGFYSTSLLWREIVGDLRFGAPEWRAAGETSMAEALHRCREASSIQGGRALLGQWVQDDRDKNVNCPGADLRPWFHQY